jgi:hypothetical protein
MSGPEKSLQDFLQRWSRRKLSAQERGAAEPDARAEQTNTVQGGAPADAASEPSAALSFDPASLPPIETIGAGTDIRPFLAPGVPENITRAALRRAWVSDPAIRDFIGIAENQWDFTKPDGVPGFGAFELTPALRRMAAGILGGERDDDAVSSNVESAGVKSGKTAPPDPTAVTVPAAVTASPVAVGSVRGTGDNDKAMAADSSGGESARMPPPPKHGGALPS